VTDCADIASEPPEPVAKTKPFPGDPAGPDCKVAWLPAVMELGLRIWLDGKAEEEEKLSEVEFDAGSGWNGAPLACVCVCE